VPYQYPFFMSSSKVSPRSSVIGGTSSPLNFVGLGASSSSVIAADLAIIGDASVIRGSSHERRIMRVV
jgi:hypothetical protein